MTHLEVEDSVRRGELEAVPLRHHVRRKRDYAGCELDDAARRRVERLLEVPEAPKRSQHKIPVPQSAYDDHGRQAEPITWRGQRDKERMVREKRVKNDVEVAAHSVTIRAAWAWHAGNGHRVGFQHAPNGMGSNRSAPISTQRGTCSIHTVDTRHEEHVTAVRRHVRVRRRVRVMRVRVRV